jgi:hypothetical protein
VPKSKEHREKIGRGNKGKKRSPEFCREVSERNKGMTITPEQREKQVKNTRKFFKDNPDVLERITREKTKRKWFYNPETMETAHTKTSPGSDWIEGRPISYLGAPWWTDGVSNRRSFESPGVGWVHGICNDHRKRRFQCTLTGHISSPGALTRYQKTRGIDPSNRVRVE